MVACAAHAQELEPRAYSPNPMGVDFLVLGYSRSAGGVLFDPSLPLSDVDAHLNAGVLGYGHTFGLFGRSASAAIAMPYVWGDISGNVGEARRDITRSGPADAKLRFSVNLIGGPALTTSEFARRVPRTTLGASLVVAPPVGEYDSTKLVNLGANRWSFKPEIGLSQPLGRWYAEAYAGVWLFTDNDNFFNGKHREQDPITTVQGHVSYTFRPRMWLAFDATHYNGGRTTVDGVRNADLQSNARIGLTFSLPVGQHQSIKLSWSEGATTRVGGDFSSFGLAWQYTWLE